MSNGPTVKVDVTPLFTQGNEVICAIDPQNSANSKGGMLKLDKGQSCSLEFNLKSGTAGNLTWDPSGAFAWDYNDCPGNNGVCPAPYSAGSPNGSTLTVAVQAVSQEEAAHYRLNFKDASNKSWHFDPVIIRD
ncbi:MAG TPA: hypothetical protein VFY95_08055 [Sphingomicrobium sp.]